MPRSSFGYDADNAYYASLREKVLSDREAQRQTAAAAERERRTSEGLPSEDVKRGWWRRRSSGAGRGGEGVAREVGNEAGNGDGDVEGKGSAKKEVVDEREVREGKEVNGPELEKKTFGEKAMNLVFNAGRRAKMDDI